MKSREYIRLKADTLGRLLVCGMLVTMMLVFGNQKKSSINANNTQDVKGAVQKREYIDYVKQVNSVARDTLKSR